jgi:hypothetical protein
LRWSQQQAAAGDLAIHHSKTRGWENQGSFLPAVVSSPLFLAADKGRHTNENGHGHPIVNEPQNW